jgi:outer membrane murein-binding lipoprotein Lpp
MRNNKQKNQVMKFAKLSIFALAMGLFVASCGNSETKTEETKTDSTAVTTPAAAPVDTTAVAPTAPAADSNAAAAPTADTTKKTTETKTEVKH